MDPATFKTIISIQKKEMKDVGEEKKKMTGVGTKRDNQEWASFFVAAKKSSRKKKKTIMAAKREEKNIEERKIQKWLRLYYKRHDSDEDNIEFTAAKVPYGAWGRVD